MNKNYIYLVLLCLPWFYACEKQITVDVPTTSPKLVVDGWFSAEPGENGQERTHMVRLTTSLPYFSSEKFPVVDKAIVELKDDKGNTYNLKFDIPMEWDANQNKEVSNPQKGRYILKKNLEVGISYKLCIKLEDETKYESEPQMVIPYNQTPRIFSEYKEADDVTYDDDGYYIGFEPKFEKDQDYYFLWQLYRHEQAREEDSAYSYAYTGYLFGSNAYTSVDESQTYFDEATNLGESYFIKQYVVSKEIYDYMRLAEEQRDNEGTQFSPPPAPLRSNIKRIGGSNLDDDALGLFVVSSVQKTEIITIKESN